MGYSNSSLVVFTEISPNKTVSRNQSIDRITPHCVVGQCTAEGLGEWFSRPTTGASSNYGVDKDGRVGMYCEEKDRSWCSSSGANDNRAITIEVASDKEPPYAFNDKAYKSLINLCVDICKRNGKTKLLWFGDKTKTLSYSPKSNEMVLTVHRWFANTDCPGDWMYSRMGDLANKVTAELNKTIETNDKNETIYRVQIGAYSVKKNAEAQLAKAKAAGFSDAYIKAETIKAETTKKEEVKVAKRKTNAEIAKEIYSGTCSDSRWNTWGNGNTRIERLKAAGYDPVAIQKEVNKLF